LIRHSVSIERAWNQIYSRYKSGEQIDICWL
jgi:hypothetical protein